MEEKCVRIRITGKVQGVFFRKFTKLAALDLNASGFVRNEPDGSVYIEAKAGSDQIEKFIAWCRKGPEHAAVDRVEVEEIELKNFSSFSISYF